MIRFVPRWVVVALGVAAALTAFLGLRAVTGLGGPGLAAFAGHYVYDAARLLPVLVLVARAMRRGDDRAAWALLAAGSAIGMAGDMVWGVLYEQGGAPPVPSVADVLYVASYVPMLLAVVFFLRDRVHALRSGLWLDGLIGGLAIATVFAVLVVEPVRRSLEGSASDEVLTQLAYPLADLVLLAGLVAACSLRGWRLDLQWLALVGGTLLFVVTDAVYLLLVLDGTYVSGGVVDLGWLLPGLLWAAVSWLPRSEVDEQAPPSRLTIAAPLVLGLAAAVTVFAEAFERDTDRLTLVLGFGTMLCVFARFALTSRDNVRLLAASRDEAATDPLTGLANRRRLDKELARLGTDPRVLVSFDLDGFKLYNDTFGHPAGDILLRMIGEALIAAVGDAGVAFRVGGDEFCALVDAGGEDADAVAQRLAAAMHQAGQGFDVSASYGAVRLPDEAGSAEEGVRLADRRLYARKHSRRASAVRQSSAVLVAMQSERDPELGSHVGHVADLAEAVARRLGMAEDEVADVRRGAALHDIGKLAIPESILNKPAGLTAEEAHLMRQHTLIGERVLSAAPALERVAELVRASHERWDGGGYPDGLAGEQIPLGARIIFVCDAYDAMTAPWPYQQARSPEDALAELRRCAGTQFDARVVAAFVAEGAAPTRAPAVA